LAALRGSEDAGAVQGAQRRRQLRPDRHPQHRPLRALHRGREGHHQGHPAQLRRLPVRRLLLRRRQHGAHLPASQRAGQRAPGQGRRDSGDRQHAGGLGGRRAVRAGADHRDQFADAAVRRLAADHRQGRGLPAETAADAGCQPRQPEAGRDLPVHADGARTMNPLSFVESLFSSIGSLFSRIGSLYAQGADTAKKPWLRRIVVTLVLLVVLAGLVFLALAILPQLPMRFWQVLGLCVVALVVLWWFMAGQRKASLKGRTRKRIGDLGPGNAEDEQEPLKRMTAAIGEAKRTIARSPDIDKGRTPLYRIPWFLMIGDEASDIDGLLRAATEVSPFPPPDRDEMEPDDVWRWWFFKSMIAIEMHPRVVCDNGARLDRGIWYQPLMKLADEREKLPLNGIVVAVAAQTLLGPGDALKDAATRPRGLVDEAMEHLQVQVPVYFVVSGLDRLHGYAQMRSALPAEAFAQALGHRFAADEVVSAAASGRVAGVVKPIEDRLLALRITALRAQHTPQARRAVFDFVESLRQAGQGLALFVNLMLEDNPFQRTPRWRGLYFAGSADAANPGGAFVADLFTRFLPGDQPLASTSLRG